MLNDVFDELFDERREDLPECVDGDGIERKGFKGLIEFGQESVGDVGEAGLGGEGLVEDGGDRLHEAGVVADDPPQIDEQVCQEVVDSHGVVQVEARLDDVPREVAGHLPQTAPHPRDLLHALGVVDVQLVVQVHGHGLHQVFYLYQIRLFIDHVGLFAAVSRGYFSLKVARFSANLLLTYKRIRCA